MDLIDIQICRLLIKNSRQPYRQISKKLGISLQGVHRRIQILENTGVIKKYYVCLSDQFLNSFKVQINGSSSLRSYDELVKSLEQDDRTLYLFFCSINEISITALLHDISEIDDYTEFLKRDAKIEEPMVMLSGTMQFGQNGQRQQTQEKPELKPIDYRILQALQEDAHKPIIDLAPMLGLSVKTIKRRIERMIYAGILEFSIQYLPQASPSSFFFLLVELKTGIDRKKYMNDFVKTYDRYILIMHTINSNPDTFLVLMWTSSQKEANDIIVELSKNPSIISPNTYVVQNIHFFRTWREKFVEDHAKIPEKK